MSEGLRKGELAMISHKFSFPPGKPQVSAKRENGHRKRAADLKSDNRLSSKFRQPRAPRRIIYL